MRIVNEGPGIAKGLSYVDGPVAGPPLDHDGIVTLTLKGHDKGVTQLENMLWGGGLEIVKSSVSHTEAGGPEAEIYFRGSLEKAVTAALSAPFLAEPGNLREVPNEEIMGIELKPGRQIRRW